MNIQYSIQRVTAQEAEPFYFTTTSDGVESWTTDPEAATLFRHISQAADYAERFVHRDTMLISIIPMEVDIVRTVTPMHKHDESFVPSDALGE